MTDLMVVIKQLKDAVQHQPGLVQDRPAFILFNSWLEKAATSRRLSEQQETSVPTAPSLERGVSDGSLADEDLEVLPLHLFHPDDPAQMAVLMRAIGKLPELVLHYLQQHVFPKVMLNQTMKLSASGVDLGGRMLFGSRLCFSGTPSDLLPSALGQCRYEMGTEAEVIRVLANPAFVSFELVRQWTVRSLLLNVAAHASKRFRALIDAGALVTGMRNQEGARPPFLPESVTDACMGVLQWPSFCSRTDSKAWTHVFSWTAKTTKWL